MYYLSDEQTNIRLVGGASQSEGRLEVLLGNQWHTVCDNTFGTEEASVVCRMLGYKSAGM